MLNVFNDWYKIWLSTVSLDTSQVVYFRSTSKLLTDSDFKLRELCMPILSKYKYFGLILDDKSPYATCIILPCRCTAQLYAFRSGNY